MKKFSVIALVVVMLALSAVPAFAKGGPPANAGTGTGSCVGGQIGIGVRTPYALSGTISALDVNARTVTITLVCGNRLVQPFIGLDVNVQTTDSTRFLLRNADGTVTPITFEQLSIGQNVSSHGSLVNNTWNAVRVTAGALLSCTP
jgi:hypothetical protein